MSENQIVITLDDVLGHDGLEGAWEAMIARLADRAEGAFRQGDTGHRGFRAAAVEAINRAIQDKLEAKLAEFLAAPIQQTDSYGNPKGEPTTFVEMIGKAVEGALTQRMDSYGNPVARDGKTLFERALADIALDKVGDAVRAEMKAVNERAKAAVAAHVAKAVAAAIKT